MLTRLAQHGDEPTLLLFSKQCYDEMDFDKFGYKFEYEAVYRNYNLGIDDPNKQIITVWENGVLIGVTVWVISESSMYFDNHKVASELVFHSLPSLPARQKLRIMRLMIQKSNDLLNFLQVKSVYISTDVRYNAVTKLLQKEGFESFSIRLYKGGCI